MANLAHFAIALGKYIVGKCTRSQLANFGLIYWRLSESFPTPRRRPSVLVGATLFSAVRRSGGGPSGRK